MFGKWFVAYKVTSLLVEVCLDHLFFLRCVTMPAKSIEGCC